MTDPNETALIASGTLPPASQTKPVVLSDLTGTVTKVRRPREHLACYSISETRRMLARRVVLRNRFERPRLRAVRIRRLCLASLKQDL